MSLVSEAAALIFKKAFSQKIGKLEIDIVLSRGVSEKSTITSNPIEAGKYINDNIIDIPTEIPLNCVISKYSLKNSVLSQISSLYNGKIPNRLKDAHDELYRLKEAKEPITLVMKYRMYENMIMRDLDFTDNAGDGETLRFTVLFQQINVVESQLISIDNSNIRGDSAKKASSFGRQTGGAKAAAPAVKPSSLSLGQFVKSLF